MRGLTLAPVAFAWSAQALQRFYQQVASEQRIERVYLGEVVCRKRGILSLSGWLELADLLQQSGKEVVFSLPWLINSLADERYVDKVLSVWPGVVEANDLTGVAAASAAQRPFVGGNQLAIYNPATLTWMVAKGLRSWSPPVELGQAWLDAIVAGAEALPEIELFAFGHQMLGISARCMQARSAGKCRADCQQLCLDAPSATLHTLDNQALLLANGHTIMSSGECNLLALESKIPEYVGRLRVSLTYPDQLALLASYHQEVLPEHVNGFWFGKAGLSRVASNT